MGTLRFSGSTLGLLSQVLPEYFTHTGLETVFMTSGIDEPPDSAGVSKQRRVLNVIRDLRDGPPDQAEAALIALFSELLERITRSGTIESSDLESAEQRLLASPERDGWTFGGHQLNFTDPSRSDQTAAAYQPSPSDPAIDLATSRRVFVVHGRDLGAKDIVARFVERLGYEAVVLHEQANRGRTVLEKFLAEAADAAFALVLLTPDDIGGLADGLHEQQRRARQNVVLEFGYFVGLLGRERVAALVGNDVELPSDLAGLLYIPFSSTSDEWKMAVAREMRAAGMSIDLNAI